MRQLGFFISEAIIGLKRSALMMFIAVGTITVSLIIFGVFLLMSMNLNNMAEFISSKLEIRVFLRDSLQSKDIKNFQSQLQQMAHVRLVEFVDRRDAWEAFQGQYQHLSLMDFTNKNPLPHAFKVFLEDSTNISNISQSILVNTNYVEDVVYGGVMAERMQSFIKLIKVVGLVLVSFLTLATLFIIVNTIRLTVINRQAEIAIMKLVGATHGFISGPFLIEGLIIGGSGAILSVFFLRFFYVAIGNHLHSILPYFPLILDSMALIKIYVLIILMGSSLGLLGAYLSISKTLKRTI